MTVDSHPAALRQALYAPVHAVMGLGRILREGQSVEGPVSRSLDAVMAQAQVVIKSIDEVADVAAAALCDTADRLSRNTAKVRSLITECDALLKDAELFRDIVATEDAAADVSNADSLVDLTAKVRINTERFLRPASGGQACPEGDGPLESYLEVLEQLREVERTAAPEMSVGTVLVVDDDESTREILNHFLKQKGFRVYSAAGGEAGLQALRASTFDLVLLDIMMPGMSGYDVLKRIKSAPELAEIPVVMLSAFNETKSVAYCIELGADDYLAKPIVPTLLMARIASSLDRKRMHDRENAFHARLLQEQRRSRSLLLNILPENVAERLHQGQRMIADHFDSVTVLFCDVAGFTRYASSLDASGLVRDLNQVFQAFDDLVQECGVEKIKTIGDAYLAVGGLHTDSGDHARRIAALAHGMLGAVRSFRETARVPWEVRIGIHSGPVTAGVIGKLKFSYDIWGDTVNVASRMESTGVVNAIQVSDVTYRLLKDGYHLEQRGRVEVKGKGSMRTWLLGEAIEAGEMPRGVSGKRVFAAS